MAKRKGKVLVVDDDSDVRSTYKDVLQAYGYKVKAVASGEACLKQLHTNADEFGLVVLDVLLPAQTGYDVVEVIRANWPDLPVVMVSGKVDKLTREALDKLGASEFLEKPVDPDVLIHTVDRHIRKV
jgi:CheY-like chemotaxis protein